MARRIKDAADLDGYEMKAHKDGGRSILVVKIDFAVNLDETFDRLHTTEPLNASFEVAAHNVAEVVPREIVALSIRLRRETEVQVYKDYMFAATWKHV